MEADRRSELEAWLSSFAAALRNKTRRRMCPAYIAGLIGPGDRKVFSPWQHGTTRLDTTGFITSLAAASGTKLPWRWLCLLKPTGKLEAMLPS